MIPPGPLQPLYAGLFVILAVVALVQVVRARGRNDRIGWALELAMSISMFVMVFDWGVSRWVVAQSIVFGAGGLWYLVRALGVGERDEVAVLADETGLAEAEVADEQPAPSAHSSHSPMHLAHHALMMVAMLWMLIAMLPHGRNLQGHFAMVSPRQTWAFFSGGALAVLLAVALIALVVGWIRGRDRHGFRAYDVAMTAGMWGMVAPMLTL